MEMKLYKKIIDEVAENNVDCRIWLDFCGEALLAGYKLYYMIDYAKKKGLTNVFINSNGTLLKPEFADMLLDAGIDYISLDCDGFSKEVYESIRVGGDRDIFYSNVEYLLEEKKRRNSDTVIDVKIIEMEQNRDEIDDILQYWRKRGAWTAVRRVSDWAGAKFTEGESAFENRIACGHLIGTATISWDGVMSGCAWDADCQVKCGNVNEKSIREIWHERNETLVAIHMEHRWSELPDGCKRCSTWKNIGEERYDDKGNPVERNYEENKKLY